jgi:group I intron endonuclease
VDNYLIYKHTSPSGKSYIGLTNDYDRRCNEHQRVPACRAFHSAIKKYGWDNFTHTIVDSGLSLAVANELEEFLIEELNTLAPNGYNLQTGGTSRLLCEETKTKMSEANRGKPKSEAHKQTIRAIRTGTTHTQATKDKVSAVRKGKPKSAETKQKISDGRKGMVFTQEHKDNIRKAKTKKILDVPPDIISIFSQPAELLDQIQS